jgi:hypothetical protein
MKKPLMIFEDVPCPWSLIDSMTILLIEGQRVTIRLENCEEGTRTVCCWKAYLMDIDGVDMSDMEIELNEENLRGWFKEADNFVFNLNGEFDGDFSHTSCRV